MNAVYLYIKTQDKNKYCFKTGGIGNKSMEFIFTS